MHISIPGGLGNCTGDSVPRWSVCVLWPVAGARDGVKNGEWLCDIGPHSLVQCPLRLHPPSSSGAATLVGLFLTPLACLGTYTQTRTHLDAGIGHCQPIPAPPSGTSWRLVASPRRCPGGFPRLAHTQLAAHANRNASLRPSMSALD